jgi:hypothetical protein
MAARRRRSRRKSARVVGADADFVGAGAFRSEIRHCAAAVGDLP